jgi:hypothetical protein
MVIIDYRGPNAPRYANISSRADLGACITWLLEVLDEMEARGRDADTIVDLKDYNGEAI